MVLVIVVVLVVAVVQRDGKPIRGLKIGISCLIYTQTAKHTSFDHEIKSQHISIYFNFASSKQQQLNHYNQSLFTSC